ncbi:MAG TPA: lytic transglycosylase domain-containing protein [Terriglobales bacterium]|nr:lytic transglycosylase domain-containing protein [Terriglobales bacterium]
MNLTKTIGIVLLLSATSVVSSATDVATLRNGFTIRHESRAPLGETTRLFLTADGSSFVDVPTAEIVQIEPDLNPPAAPEQNALITPQAPVSAGTALPNSTAPTPASASQHVDVLDVVNAASGRYRLDPDLVTSVIRAESGFKVHAISPKGAQGLMQLMPGTASKLGVPNAFDPEANVDGGTRYLRELLERYNFDLIKALAAYNAGPHRVEQYNGVPPYLETRKYVASIVRDFNRKKLAQQKANSTLSAKAQSPSRAKSKASTAQAVSSQPSAKTARTTAAPTVKRPTAATGN